MSDAWDDRKKSLEEEYFRRKEAEAIEKQRVEREAEAALAAALKCPRCDGVLSEMSYEDVLVDRCGSCGGVWLDAGELERLTEREERESWLGRLFRSSSGK